jgi:hypothetical protein
MTYSRDVPRLKKGWPPLEYMVVGMLQLPIFSEYTKNQASGAIEQPKFLVLS